MNKGEKRLQLGKKIKENKYQIRFSKNKKLYRKSKRKKMKKKGKKLQKMID